MFADHAKAITTGSAVKFVMADGDTTTAGAYEFVIVDAKDRVFTDSSTASALQWNGSDKEEDESLIKRVIEAIKKLAADFRTLRNETVFMDALNGLFGESSTPSALGFVKEDAEGLLKAQRDLLDAEVKVESTSQAVYDFVRNEVTTPTAIKIIMTPSDNRLESKVLELTTTSSAYNMDSKSYHIDFELFRDSNYTFKVEATTGAVITYTVNETWYPTADYMGTEVDGKLYDGNAYPTTGDKELVTGNVHIFNNIYDDGCVKKSL